MLTLSRFGICSKSKNSRLTFEEIPKKWLSAQRLQVKRSRSYQNNTQKHKKPCFRFCKSSHWPQTKWSPKTVWSAETHRLAQLLQNKYKKKQKIRRKRPTPTSNWEFLFNKSRSLLLPKHKSSKPNPKWVKQRKLKLRKAMIGGNTHCKLVRAQVNRDRKKHRERQGVWLPNITEMPTE